MKLIKPTRFLFFILMGAISLLITSGTLAQGEYPPEQDIVRGAQLYDKWFAVLGIYPPPGNMPIWTRQSTNTRSGEDTWRCSECHGWDYRGAQGEYGTGSHYTGFPDVMTLAKDLSVEEIISHLQGSKDPAHDFSTYMDNTALTQVAQFIKYGTIDDTQYIDPISLRVLNADVQHGKTLYQTTCVECHGSDGKKIIFRSEGINEYLGSVANRDPWRFLHRTRFGTAGTDMPVGVSLGWTAEDGRDILAYSQSLPTGGEIISQPTQNPQNTPVPLRGGPATNIWTGILTSLTLFLGMGIYAALFIGGFIIVGLIVVTILRGRSERSKRK
jgi:mono/diheme cytochrome c family protein